MMPSPARPWRLALVAAAMSVLALCCGAPRTVAATDDAAEGAEAAHHAQGTAAAHLLRLLRARVLSGAGSTATDDLDLGDGETLAAGVRDQHDDLFNAEGGSGYQKTQWNGATYVDNGWVRMFCTEPDKNAKCGYAITERDTCTKYGVPSKDTQSGIYEWAYTVGKQSNTGLNVRYVGKTDNALRDRCNAYNTGNVTSFGSHIHETFDNLAANTQQKIVCFWYRWLIVESFEQPPSLPAAMEAEVYNAFSSTFKWNSEIKKETAQQLRKECKVWEKKRDDEKQKLKAYPSLTFDLKWCQYDLKACKDDAEKQKQKHDDELKRLKQQFDNALKEHTEELRKAVEDLKKKLSDARKERDDCLEKEKQRLELENKQFFEHYKIPKKKKFDLPDNSKPSFSSFGGSNSGDNGFVLNLTGAKRNGDGETKVKRVDQNDGNDQDSKKKKI